MTKPASGPRAADELAALYSIGALTTDERRAFEQRLARDDAEAAAALRELDPVVQALADALPAISPSARIRAALLQQIATIRPGDPEPDTLHPELVIQRAFDAAWEEMAAPGVRRRVLCRDPQRRQITMLVRMAAGARFPSHVHDGPEQSLVLEGDLHVDGQVLREGDYQFAPAGSIHDGLYSETGCLALVIATLHEETVEAP